MQVSVPGYYSDQTERLQRRAVRSIFSDHSYGKALDLAGITTIVARYDELSSDLFEKIISNNGRPKGGLFASTRSQPTCLGKEHEDLFLWN